MAVTLEQNKMKRRKEINYPQFQFPILEQARNESLRVFSFVVIPQLQRKSLLGQAEREAASGKCEILTCLEPLYFSLPLCSFCKMNPVGREK